MGIAALVVSVLALGAAGWAAFAASQQANLAAKANSTAEHALDVAKSVERVETARLHSEHHPVLEVEPVKGSRKANRHLRLTSSGPITFDSITLRPDSSDAETVRLVAAILDASEQEVSSVILQTVRVGDRHDFFLKRTSRETSGTARLLIEVREGSREWAIVTHVRFQPPPRVYFN